VQQYVAFDVSKQSSEAVIVDESGKRLVSCKVATDPLSMAAFVAKYGENVVSVGFEVGPLSTWLYHELKGAGLPVVCIASWRARAALSARLNKTDRTDAAGLADLLRAGFHHPVYVKSYAAHEVRTMLKARDSLVAQRRTLQNTIRGLLETFGLILGKGSGGRFAVLVEDALCSRPSLRRSIEPLLRVWQATREAAAAMHRQLRAMARADADCRRLMTTPLRGLLAASLPGIGSKASWPSMASARSTPWPSRAPSMTRPAFTTAVPSAPISASRHDWPGGQSSDLRRRRGQQTAEGRYQSGKHDHIGKISRAGDGFMRSLLFEAAQCLVFRSSRALALKAWFEALAARVGRKKALVALARKLAVILHAMLVHGRDFDENLQAAAVAA
jgi:transposase